MATNEENVTNHTVQTVTESAEAIDASYIQVVVNDNTTITSKDDGSDKDNETAIIMDDDDDDESKRKAIAIVTSTDDIKDTNYQSNYNTIGLNKKSENRNLLMIHEEQPSFESDMEMQRGDATKYRNLLCPVAWQFGAMFLAGYYLFLIDEAVLGVLCMIIAICYNCFVCWKQQLATESYTIGDYIISSKINFQVKLLLIPGCIMIVLALVLMLDYLFALID